MVEKIICLRELHWNFPLKRLIAAVSMQVEEMRCTGDEWRGGSLVKRTGGSARRPRFRYQNPYGGSQLSVVPDSEVTLFWPLWALQTWVSQTYMQAK